MLENETLYATIFQSKMVAGPFSKSKMSSKYHN